MVPLNPLRADPVSAAEFMRILRRRGPWTFARIDPNSTTFSLRVVTFNGVGEIPDMIEWIRRHIQKFNLYFIPNPSRKRFSRKPSESEIAYFQFAHVDLDPLDGESPTDAHERWRFTLDLLPYPPTLSWITGNGVAALWRIRKPFRLNNDVDIDRCKRVNIALAQELGGKSAGADHCQSLEHLLRLPFTINFPDARKIKKGRKVQLTGDVQHFQERRYDF